MTGLGPVRGFGSSSTGVRGAVVPGLVGRDQLGGQVGAGHDEQGLDPTAVEGVGVAEVGQDVGDALHGGVEDRDGRERGADEEPPQPVVTLLTRARIDPGRAGELSPGGLLLTRGSGLRVRGRDHAVDQCLEPGPGQPSVRIRRDPGVDEGGLLGGELAGLPRHQPSQVDPHPPGLHPRPQLRQPVAHVQGIGHQPARRDRRDPEPTRQLRGRELRDLWRPRPAEPPGLLPARLGRLDRVQGVPVVQIGVLQSGPEDLDLTTPLGDSQRLDPVEQLTARQVLQPAARHHLHVPTQA